LIVDPDPAQVAALAYGPVDLPVTVAMLVSLSAFLRRGFQFFGKRTVNLSITHIFG